MITQERLRQLFSYDENSGEFLRIKGVKKASAGVLAGTKALNGYITISVDCKRYYAHRLAWLYSYGFMPRQIDHIDRDRSNNALANLRAASNSQNGANKPMGKKECGGFKGVRKKKGAKNWTARIKCEGSEIYLGTFSSEEEAAKAYNLKALEVFGEFAELNDV